MPMLRRALQRPGREPSPTRVYLLAGLTDLPPLGITTEEQIDLGRNALEAARSIG